MRVFALKLEKVERKKEGDGKIVEHWLKEKRSSLLIYFAKANVGSEWEEMNSERFS